MAVSELWTVKLWCVAFAAMLNKTTVMNSQGLSLV